MPARKTRKTSRSKIERDVARIVSDPGAQRAALYYPGGDGGGGHRRGRGSAGAVVLPHARTSPHCTLCPKYHTTAEHLRHAGKKTRKTPAPPVLRSRKARRQPSRASRATQASPASKSQRTRATPSAATSPPPSLSPVRLVLDAVRDMPSSGRFGPDKVFISEIWDRVGPRLGMSLDEFKRWLIVMNRDRILNLARADLTGYMDPEQVERSEIRDRGASFHFVIDQVAERERWG